MTQYAFQFIEALLKYQGEPENFDTNPYYHGLVELRDGYIAAEPKEREVALSILQIEVSTSQAGVLQQGVPEEAA